MKAALSLAALLAFSAPALADALSDYMKSATQVLLLGEACSALGHAPQHDGTVVQAVADLVALGHGDREAAGAIDAMLREKGPSVTEALKEEAGASPAAAAYFCDTAYPERLSLHQSLRASIGLR